MMRYTMVIALLSASASCVAESDAELDAAMEEEGLVAPDELDGVADADAAARGKVKPADVTCNGSLCWDREWHACGGYNYKGSLSLSRSSTGVFSPYYVEVEQYTGDRNHLVNGLDWQIWLKNDNGVIGASTYHNNDDGNFGWLPLYNFDPYRSTHPYVEFLAGKSEDHQGSCWFRIYLYEPG